MPLSRKNRSCRNVLASTAASRSRFVAATNRTSMGRSVPPTGFTCRVSSVRRSLVCSASGISPTSSRNTVPPAAVASRPGLVFSAPVNDPFSWPNSSLSSSVSVSAAQLMQTSGPPGARRVRVDPLGQHLLAGAGLAQDEDIDEAAGAVAGRRAFGEAIQLAYALGLEHRPLAGVRVGPTQQRAGPADERLGRPAVRRKYRHRGARLQSFRARPPPGLVGDSPRALGIGIQQQHFVVAGRVLRQEIARAQRPRDDVRPVPGRLLVHDAHADHRQRRPAALRGARTRVFQAFLERAMAVEPARRFGRPPPLHHDVGEADGHRLARLDRDQRPRLDADRRARRCRCGCPDPQRSARPSGRRSRARAGAKPARL